MAVSNLWLALLGYYALAVISAVLPWVNAEVLMLSAVPIAGSRTLLAALVVAVSAGQMTGKTIMYWLSRNTTHPNSIRLHRSLDHGLAWLRQRPGSALAVTFVSSLVGFPPFYIVSIAAGALRVAFCPFLAVGTAGRLMHFAIVAFAPELIRRAL